MNPQAHQLAAILFTDIVGYTALMQNDEELALEKLNRFKEVMTSRVAEFHGEIIQYYGDACLAKFNSSLDAVKAAIGVQLDFKSPVHVPARVGLHLGDVMPTGDNVYGDAVNIASRIQSLAPTGGIYLSEAVHQNISNKKDIKSVFVSQEDLKNVANPVRIYRITTDVEIVEIGTNSHPVIEIVETYPQKSSIKKLMTSKSVRKRGFGIAVIILIFFGLFFLGRWSNSIRGKENALVPIHSYIPIENVIPTNAGQYSNFEISPDGKTIVYMQLGLGLFIHDLNDFKTKLLPGTEDVRPTTLAVFSPDGNSIAYGKLNTIIKYDLKTGLKSNVVKGRGTKYWGADDNIYFDRGLGTGGIWSVSSSGNSLRQVSYVNDSLLEVAHTYPQLLTDKKTLIYTALGPSGGSRDSKVVIQRINSHEHFTLVEHAIFGRFISTGDLLYADNEGNVFLAPIDIKKMKLKGTARVVLSDIQTATWGGSAFFSVSENGSLLFYPRNERPTLSVEILNLDGQPMDQGLMLDSIVSKNSGHGASNFSISPDGNSLIGTGRTFGSSDIWLFDMNKEGAERITLDKAEDEFPVWSPRGKYITYTSADKGKSRRIYSMKSSGGEEPILVKNWPRHIHITSWSPDSAYLAAYDYASHSVDVWIISVDGKDSIPVATTTFEEQNATFSPDGKWLAYESDESGHLEIYVIPFPSLTNQRQVSVGGGTLPSWSQNGKYLYYRQGKKLVKLGIDTENNLKKGKMEILFEANFENYAVFPDEKRVLILKYNLKKDFKPLRLVTNWFEKLKKEE